MGENNNRFIIQLRHGTDKPKKSDLEEYEPCIFTYDTNNGQKVVRFGIKIGEQLWSTSLTNIDWKS